MPEEYYRAKEECGEAGRKAHSDWGRWSEERRNGYIYGCLKNRGWVKGKDGHMVKK